MKVHNVLTFIVTHNYGRSHTLSLAAWKVYAGAVAGAVTLTLLAVLSVLFLAVFPRWRDSDQSLRLLLQERDALREQILAINQEALEVKDKRMQAQSGEDEDAVAQEGDSAGAPNADRYTQPIRIAALNARLSQAALEVSFNLISQDRGRGNRGGYLFTVLENQDQKPPVYQSGPGIQVNSAGFPEAYKEGLIFPHVQKTLAVKRKIKLESTTAAFTHITVYLFSPRGGLIAQERFALERSLFPATQQAGQPPAHEPALAGLSRSG